MRNSRFLTLLLLYLSISVTGYAQQEKGDNPSQDYNHLKDADSPYLPEYADNPVYWPEWRPEALQLAKKEN